LLLAAAADEFRKINDWKVFWLERGVTFFESRFEKRESILGLISSLSSSLLQDFFSLLISLLI
jgi:hypothetical protein